MPAAATGASSSTSARRRRRAPSSWPVEIQVRPQQVRVRGSITFSPSRSSTSTAWAGMSGPNASLKESTQRYTDCAVGLNRFCPPAVSGEEGPAEPRDATSCIHAAGAENRPLDRTQRDG